MIASSFWQRKISGCNERRSNRRVYETLTIAPPPYYISLPMSVCRHSIDSGMDAFPIGPIVRSRVYIISLQMNLRSSPPRQWRNLLHSSSSLRSPPPMQLRITLRVTGSVWLNVSSNSMIYSIYNKRGRGNNSFIHGDGSSQGVHY